MHLRSLGTGSSTNWCHYAQAKLVTRRLRPTSFDQEGPYQYEQRWQPNGDQPSDRAHHLRAQSDEMRGNRTLMAGDIAKLSSSVQKQKRALDALPTNGAT